MMSLNKVTLEQVVKNQFIYKLGAYSGVFISLIILQLIAVLFSLNGVGMSGGGSEQISYSLHYYSGNLVFIFTMLWVFIVSIIITSKVYRNEDFSFVSNRLSSDLSNILFVIFVSVIGTVTALLSTFLIKVILLFLPKFDMFYYTPTSMNMSSFVFFGIVIALCYVLISAAAGYFVGTLVRLSSLFKIMVPVVFIGYLIFGGMISEVSGLATVVQFFYFETSLITFVFKAILTVIVLFASSGAIFNRVEVRQ
ncbi:hypothetical protein FZC74_15005 [Sutcliffiella horikoshii]|uniref:Uncharacterized protein n=1 Tax=Sutcliffiella horikoshii TaxID=79883 RepID=A0AA94WNC5_9BACI|nr:hypothetical protein [Sutcliffiella horikoshii]TYS57735.1 hypothetical protein FZC74_15005 [Sutcliffiella horikoshii]